MILLSSLFHDAIQNVGPTLLMDGLQIWMYHFYF
jgi:hypothetical protein